MLLDCLEEQSGCDRDDEKFELPRVCVWTTSTNNQGSSVVQGIKLMKAETWVTLQETLDEGLDGVNL